MNDTQQDIIVPDDLLNQTVLIGRSSSVCGKCGADALPNRKTRCTSCRARWHFVASATHYVGTDQLIASLERDNPNLAFIGYNNYSGGRIVLVPSPKAQELIRTLPTRRSMWIDAKMAAVCVTIGMVLFLAGVPLGGLLLDLLGLWGLACVVIKRQGWFNWLGIPLMRQEDWRRLPTWRYDLYWLVWGSETLD